MSKAPAGAPLAARRLLREVILLVLVALPILAVLIGLGIWQLDRLEWKQALIARVAAGLAAAPVPAPGPEAWPEFDAAAEEYRPVSVTGRFDHAREIHLVQALTEPEGPVGGLGFLVMTPLRTAEGWWVYVNRGFVPREKKDPATRSKGQVEGEVTVVGLLRAPHRRAWFAPADDPAGNAWFSRDPALFAAASGLPAAEVAPYLIDARYDPDLPGGLPQGGETILTFPNNHLQYALTWFGLAAVLVAVVGAFVAKRGRARRDHALDGGPR